MRLQAIALMVIMGALVSLHGCSDPDVEIGLDQHAKSRLESIPGAIGIKLETEKQVWRFRIKQGVLNLVEALPDARKEARAVTADPIRGAQMLREEGDFSYRGPYLVSPNGVYVGAAISPKSRDIYSPTGFVVADLRTQKLVARVKIEPVRLIDGFAWSPDSTMIAVLEHEPRKLARVQNVLASIAGHPVSYNAYLIEIYYKNGDAVAASKLASNLVGSWGEIVWTN